MPPSPGPMTDGSKKPMSNTVNSFILIKVNNLDLKKAFDQLK